jgi:hypothetical protein
LTTLSEKNVSWLSDNLGVVLGISLSIASYGLPHHIDSIPQYLLPTSLLFPDSKPTTTSKVSVERTRTILFVTCKRLTFADSFQQLNTKNKSRRKQKKNSSNKIKATPLDDILVVPDINWSQTSESDFSDSEAGRIAFLTKTERKIRLGALSLLLHLVKVSFYLCRLQCTVKLLVHSSVCRSLDCQ